MTNILKDLVAKLRTHKITGATGISAFLFRVDFRESVFPISTRGYELATMEREGGEERGGG